MKVIGCSQNNLARPSFGMYVDFHADDMTTKGEKLPSFELMRRAMLGINLSPEAEYMSPSVVFLKHEGERKEPVRLLGIKIYNKIIDIWQVVAGDVKSEPFETARRKPDLDTVERKLSKAVRTVCNQYCSDPFGKLARQLGSKNVVV